MSRGFLPASACGSPTKAMVNLRAGDGLTCPAAKTTQPEMLHALRRRAIREHRWIRRALERWRQRAEQLQRETYALYLACKDPRVPWYAKAVAACIVGYALSPIDLIPDFIPVLGYVDDLIVIPLGVVLVRKMIPQTVLDECRIKAQATMQQGTPIGWIAAGAIIALWLGLAALGILFILRAL